MLLLPPVRSTKFGTLNISRNSSSRRSAPNGMLLVSRRSSPRVIFSSSNDASIGGSRSEDRNSLMMRSSSSTSPRPTRGGSPTGRSPAVLPSPSRSMPAWSLPIGKPLTSFKMPLN